MAAMACEVCFARAEEEWKGLMGTVLGFGENWLFRILVGQLGAFWIVNTHGCFTVSYSLLALQ